ncbi:MAG: hypothetical protein C4541_12070 [Candidatus Auribacter fodinae]|jgi:hypothetical protein|uniref:PEP-CTERM sorting domain-containing protein n=1 Tax=Candidatus Auribacter fodinae TaxID=2093366 RepID=A0A3A4QRC8_9BACT|nr:MAG: hypothetical protein C4541_12070 [Candidatus Auribacter fodinae]
MKIFEAKSLMFFFFLLSITMLFTQKANCTVSISDITRNGNDYLFVFEDGDGNEKGVSGQLKSNTGSAIGSSFTINTYTLNEQSKPSVASDNTNFLVTWQSAYQDGYASGIYGQFISSNGSKVGSEFRINAYTASDPSVGYNGSNYLTVWDGQDGNYTGIYGQRISAEGTKIGSEFQINTYTQYDQRNPSVTPNSDNFLITWESGWHTGSGQDGDRHGIFGQIVSGDGALIGSELQINTYTIESQLNSCVASNDENYFVVWMSQDQDGNDLGVFGQLISRNGDLVGDEIQINTYTDGIQGEPYVVSNGDNFLVTWLSNGFSQSGIYGQFFDSNGMFLGDEFKISNGSIIVTATDGQNYLVRYDNGWGILNSPEAVPEPSVILLFAFIGIPFLMNTKKHDRN